MKNPFVYNLKNAETFGRVSSINDYYINLPDTEDKVAYWNENAILPSGIVYFNSTNTSGNIWLKISDQDLVSSNTSIVRSSIRYFFIWKY